jgi:hypothetical protein
MKVGQIPIDHFDSGANMNRASRKPGVNAEANAGDAHLAELLDLLMVHRVPGNIESAAATAAVDDTWEDFDVITLLNTALTTAAAPLIRTGEAVMLYCTLEWVNGEAGVNNAKYANGGVPDDDDTVRDFATAAAAASGYEYGVWLVTDEDGNIKLEVDDVANLSLVVHLEAYQYVRIADSSV